MKTTSDRRKFLKSVTTGSAAVMVGAPLGIGASKGQATESEFLSYFVQTWMRAKDCTVEYCGAMSEDAYHFKPVPEIRSFAEQMLHIAESSVWMAQNFLGGKDAPQRNYNAEGKKRDEVKELVSEAFDYIGRVLEGLSDEDLSEEVETFVGPLNKHDVVLMMRDHITHHRGQSVIYLRLNGIEPPSWVGH